jgi:hypothetical protein
MLLPNRANRLVYRDDVGVLVCDNVGRIHRLDDDLTVAASSPVVPVANGIYAIALADDVVVTKDKFGTLAKWSLDTLEPIDLVDAAMLRDESNLLEDEEPSPTIHRGLGIWNGRVFFNNGYLQFTVVDLATFRVEHIGPGLSAAHLEWFCVDRPGIHAVSDKVGRLWLGDLDTLEFPVEVKIDEGANLHRIAYDPVHDRFWVTQDSGEGELENIANGVVTLLPDGTVEHSLPFTQDDVECLAFGRDFSEAYVGGFDGRVHVFDNSRRELRIVRSLGPFSHQVSDLVVTSAGDLVVLSQDGAIVKLDPSGRRTRDGAFRPQCAWDIQPDRRDPRRLLVATDDGVAVVRAGDTAPHHLLPLTVEAHHRHGMGFCRRVVALADGSYAAITRGHWVFRADESGHVRWRRRLDGLPQTISVSPGDDRLLVATSTGAVELAADDGSTVDELGIDGIAIWATSYLPAGDRVIASRNGTICAFPPGSAEPSWRVETGEYPKRMRYEGGVLLVTGEGGVKEVAVDGSGVGRRWYELLDNTCENAAVVDGTIYATTYGAQIGVYDVDSGELHGLIEPTPDYAKAAASVRTDDGQAFLLVGGRGGWITCFWLDGPVPRKVRELYLPAATPPAADDRWFVAGELAATR